MSHYFLNDPDLRSSPRRVDYAVAGRSFSLLSDRGVFAKDRLDRGTELLLETVLPLPLGEKILDLGCGYGAIALTIAALHPEAAVTASDVNRRALALCSRNAHALGLQGRLSILESDVYQNIQGTFTAVLSNPPIRAGKSTLLRIWQETRHHLTAGGNLYAVIGKRQGALSTLKTLKDLYGTVTTLASKHGYLVICAGNERGEGVSDGND